MKKTITVIPVNQKISFKGDVLPLPVQDVAKTLILTADNVEEDPLYKEDGYLDGHLPAPYEIDDNLVTGSSTRDLKVEVITRRTDGTVKLPSFKKLKPNPQVIVVLDDIKEFADKAYNDILKIFNEEYTLFKTSSYDIWLTYAYKNERISYRLPSNALSREIYKEITGRDNENLLNFFIGEKATVMITELTLKKAVRRMTVVSGSSSLLYKFNRLFHQLRAISPLTPEPSLTGNLLDDQDIKDIVLTTATGRPPIEPFPIAP